MRLLLDEMISPAIARELRQDGFDVEAIKRDRPELESVADIDLSRRMALEDRATVTNNIADFQQIHTQLTARGEEHAGMIFTSDTALPRRKADNPLWVTTLTDFLAAHPADDACRSRIVHLP